MNTLSLAWNEANTEEKRAKKYVWRHPGDAYDLLDPSGPENILILGLKHIWANNFFFA